MELYNEINLESRMQANTTSILQPMEQGVISTFAVLFEKYILKAFGCDIEDFLW